MSSVSLQNALAALSVTGVTRAYGDKPLDVEVADLPAQWTGNPSSTQERLTYTLYDAPTHECSVYWAVLPRVQGDSQDIQTNAAVLGLMDNIRTAMNSFTGFKNISYSLSPEIVTVNGFDFDGVIMSVTAKD